MAQRKPYTIEKMFAASFRGVAFLTDGVRESGGQKIITHEFVNSNHRVIESQGILNPTYSVTALLEGEDYVARKESLIKAMQKAGSGEFMHPFEGRKTVHPIDYSVTQDEKSLGQAIVELNFSSEVPDSNSSAVTELTSISIKSQCAIVRTKLTGEFAANFTFKPKKDPFGLGKLLNAIGKLSRAIGAVLGKVTAVTDSINEVSSAVDGLSNDIGKLINTPSLLAGSFMNAMSSLTNAASTPLKALEAQRSLFKGTDSPTTSTLASSRTSARDSSSQAISTLGKTAAVVEQASAISDIDFSLASDVQDVATNFNADYNALIETNIGQELRDSLDELNRIVQDYLKVKAENTPNTFTITTQPIPLQTLLYRYYGNADNIQLISNLNGIIDVSTVSGEIILVSVNDNTN
jgi:prophage DNA circulation protein